MAADPPQGGNEETAEVSLIKYSAVGADGEPNVFVVVSASSSVDADRLEVLVESLASVTQGNIDRKWVSNFLFFIGSILYTWVSVWDMRNEETWYDDEAKVSREYTVLSAAAASCYVFDSALQIAQVTPSRHSHLRRSLLAEISLGATFFIGALMDFLSAVTANLDSSTVSNATAVTAVHAYLVNAILLLAGKRPVSGCSFIIALEVVGDLLFVAGSLIDVTLSYFYNDSTTDAGWMIIDRFNLLSSVLWLVDSLLYIAADYFGEKEESAGGDDDFDDASSAGASDTEQTTYSLEGQALTEMI